VVRFSEAEVREAYRQVKKNVKIFEAVNQFGLCSISVFVGDQDAQIIVSGLVKTGERPEDFFINDFVDSPAVFIEDPDKLGWGRWVGLIDNQAIDSEEQQTKEFSFPVRLRINGQKVCLSSIVMSDHWVYPSGYSTIGGKWTGWSLKIESSDRMPVSHRDKCNVSVSVGSLDFDGVGRLEKTATGVSGVVYWFMGKRPFELTGSWLESEENPLLAHGFLAGVLAGRDDG